MKILRVIASMSPASGGPCQGIRNSVPALAELGVDNEVVCLDAADAEFLGRDPFPVHAVGPAKTPWAYCKALTPWLKNNISRFDAVIIHGLWLYHGYAVTEVIKSLRITNAKVPKIYVMPHGMLDPYFQRDPSRRIKALRNWFYWKLIEKRVIHGADAVLFTCEEEMKLAREAFSPYQPKREINVGYGVAEPPAYTPEMKEAFTAKCPEIGEQTYLLFLSRIHHKKGVDLLIRAYAQLAKEHLAKLASSSDSAAHSSLLTPHFPQLVIAGPLDSPYAAEMQALAKEQLPHDPFIHFPGMLQGEAKWGAFYGCEAFVLPSHQENFGIAVVEALACGKVVLISNKVNIWREIVEKKAGFVANNSQDGATELIGNFLRLGNTLSSPIACFKQHFTIEYAARELAAALGAKM